MKIQKSFRIILIICPNIPKCPDASQLYTTQEISSRKCTVAYGERGKVYGTSCSIFAHAYYYKQLLLKY